MLLNLGFTTKIKGHSVYLYRQGEIKRYFDIIGSNNMRHAVRFTQYFKLKELLRRSTQVVDEARLESV